MLTVFYIVLTVLHILLTVLHIVLTVLHIDMTGYALFVYVECPTTGYLDISCHLVIEYPMSSKQPASQT